MATFKEVNDARLLPALSEVVTLKEIKQAYRRMSFRYHPDRGVSEPEQEDRMKRLNWAYDLLMDYCARYKYAFGEEDVARAYPEDEHLRRYTSGWFDNSVY